MDNIDNLSFENENDFKVEYEIINIENLKDNELKEYIKKEIEDIDRRIEDNNLKIQDYNEQIKKFTNQADAVDYTIAISSGILAGIIDSFFVGEFSLGDGKKWGNEQLEKIVKKLGKNDDLTEAIKNLEKNHIPSDYFSLSPDKNVFPFTHRLDALAHHPTPIGLIASILTQFTKKGYFQNKEGEFFTILADKHIGESIGEKIFKGTVTWFFHLVSDMSTPAGLPGPIVSLIKEFSLLPGINKTGLAGKITELYSNNKGDGFSLKEELGVLHQLGKQAIPVILNEVLVRAFYFFSRLIKEYKEKGNFKDIEWKNILPYKNRTLTRMLTISAGTFLAFDLLDAGIRSGGNWGVFVLRVNFVNIGRFSVSCYSEYKMEREKRKIEKEISEIYSQQLSLSNIKLSYNIAGMWISTKEAVENIEELSTNIQNSILHIDNSIKETKENLEKNGNHIDIMKKNKINEKLIKNMKNILSELG